MAKVAFCFPTNKIDESFKYLFPSIKHLQALLDSHEVVFSIVGNGQFVVDHAKQAEDILKKFNIKLNFNYVEQKNPVEIFRLRQHSVNIVSDCDYFILIDDNFEFSPGTKKYPRPSGERYNDAISHLEMFSNVGVVSCVGSLGGSIQKEEIRLYTAGKLISMQKGIVCRNILGGKLFPAESMHFNGGMEEMVLALWYNLNGFEVHKQFNNPTKHHNLKKIFEFKGRETENKYFENYGLHSQENAEKFAFNWIRKNFNSQYKFGDKIINTKFGEQNG